jgi:hypothetical protein
VGRQLNSGGASISAGRNSEREYVVHSATASVQTLLDEVSAHPVHEALPEGLRAFDVIHQRVEDPFRTSSGIVPSVASCRAVIGSASWFSFGPSEVERVRQIEAMGRFSVEVDYVDTTATQAEITRLHVTRDAEETWSVTRVELFREGEAEPYVSSG